MARGNERLLFIHIPRTGGNWVKDAMRAARIRLVPEGVGFHPQLDSLDRKGRFTFAFVRRPFEWYASTWSFKQSNPHTRNGPDDPLDPLYDLPFAEYLAEIVERWPGWLSAFYPLFVGPVDNPIDFIGRYETLADDLVTALHLAGQEFDEATIRVVAPVNVSRQLPSCPAEVRGALMETEIETYERFYAEIKA